MRYVAAVVLLAMAQAAYAQSIPNIQLVQIAAGFNAPTHITNARDGSGRLFVVEQAGLVRVVDRSSAQKHGVFLSVKGHVISGNEKGLLSVAFHPDFRNNRRLFINYTTGAANNLFTQISSLVATADRSYVNPLTERSVLKFQQPFENHNGGQLMFGQDGFLYIGTGDGGSGNDPNNNGQRLNTLLGKILRINVNARDPGKRYAVPPDNPFVGVSGAFPEIFAYGLRNPWRFSIDRVSGLLFAGDVGQDTREEVDLIQKGRNYGWRIMEGTICTPGVNPNCNAAGLEPPLIDYGHDQGDSVTGGYVFRGPSSPALQGVYIYADFITGKIWGLRYYNNQVNEHRMLLSSGLQITSFGEGEDGELYLTSYDGRVFQVKGS